MAILICGGAGYIGSHTNKILSHAGYDTVVFDSLIYGHREAVKWGDFSQGDLSNIDDIERVFKTYEIEAVLHFAAFAYVGESVSSRKAQEILGWKPQYGDVDMILSHAWNWHEKRIF